MYDKQPIMTLTRSTSQLINEVTISHKWIFAWRHIMQHWDWRNLAMWCCRLRISLLLKWIIMDVFLCYRLGNASFSWTQIVIVTVLINKQINNENKRNLILRPKDFRRGLELEASQWSLIDKFDVSYRTCNYVWYMESNACQLTKEVPITCVTIMQLWLCPNLLRGKGIKPFFLLNARVCLIINLFNPCLPKEEGKKMKRVMVEATEHEYIYDLILGRSFVKIPN